MNEDFENSIRNKLNEADIPFDQDAWSKMESLLNADNNRKRPAGWWWWLFLVPVLGGITWWILAPASPEKDVSRVTISNQTTKGEAHNNAGDSNAGDIRKITKGAVKQQTIEDPQTTANSQQTLTTPNNHLQRANTQQKSANDNHLPKANTQHTSPTNGDHLPQAKKEIIRQTAISKQQGEEISIGNNIVPIAPKTPVSETISTKLPDSSYYTAIDLLTTKKYNNAYGYTKMRTPAEIPLNKELQPDASKKNSRRKINSKGLYFGVTLGPDLNVAPSFNYGNVGFNAGLLAHYYFNQHWFVTTGVIYSKKLYGATDKDYNYPGNSSSYGLVKVNANCDVLDIPINANYTFLQVNNNTLSATLGLSNYIMLKEKYQYIYKYSPDWEKTVENQNQHYLAILNVGALYQHPAGKRLIIGVQPYAKIPLHGVGLGQVKLYSAGVSLQLNLVGKKRR